jgi:2'-phosphotransferase
MGKGNTSAAQVVDPGACIICKGTGKVVVLGTCPLCDGVGRVDGQLTKELAKMSNKAAKARAKDISQTLSMLLRHQAQEQGIQIDPQGWVSLDDALEFVNRPDDDEEVAWEGIPVTLDEIRTVANNSDKQRFAIWEVQLPMIRASQGHTMKGINPDFDPVNLDQTPLGLHGTYHEAWKIIKAEGLHKMDRNHIHMARDMPGESGVISGMRANCEVLIWIDLVKASAEGIRFMASANGVILTEGIDGVIPPKYFSKVVDRKTNNDLL